MIYSNDAIITAVPIGEKTPLQSPLPKTGHPSSSDRVRNSGNSDDQYYDAVSDEEGYSFLSPNPDLGTSSKSAKRHKDVSLWELVCLTAFNFPYGLICGTMGLFILPAESQRLFPNSESIMLGISLGIVGVTQLVCPVAGKFSDVHPGLTSTARRGPYILGGTICSGLSVVGMDLSSRYMFRWSYYAFLFLGMVGLNVIYSVQCGIVPDLTTEEVEGKASGVVAVNTITGSGIGFLLVITTNHWDYHYAYPLYLTCLILSGVMSMTVAHRLQNCALSETLRPLVGLNSTEDAETPETRTPNSEEAVDGHITYASDFNSLRILEQQLELTERRKRLSCAEIIECYTMDLSNGYDFFWVFLGRTFYYIAVSCQAFMLYYLRDVLRTESLDDRKLQIGTIALCAQGVAASVAYPIGRWSDSESVNKKTLIYAACGLMTTTYIGFMFAPLFGRFAFWFVVATALLYGLGNGCFLAVDYALALATLPSKENSAQALGIWGVSAFIGSAIGPLLWGLLIDIFGRSPSLPEGEYLYRGYMSMLCGGVIVTLLAGWIITLVKKPV